MKIVYALKTEDPQRRSILYREYARLLLADSDAPADVDRLKTIMIELDKTFDQARDDSKAIHEIQKLRTVIVTGVGQVSKLREAQRSLSAYFAETQRMAETRKREQDRLGAVAAGLQIFISQAEEAIESINHLRARNPELLADEPAATADDLKK